METKIEETPKSSGENKQNNGSQEKSNDLEVKKSENEISKEQENSRKSNKLVDSDVGKQIEEKKTVDLLEVLSETLENMLNHETILGTTSAENEDDIEMELSPTDLNVVASKNPINVESQDKTIEKVLMEEMTSVPKCEDVDLDLVKKDVEDLKISEDGEEVLTPIDKVNVPDTVLDKPTPTSVIEVFDDEDIEMTSIDEKKPDTLDADILDIKDEKIIQEILDDYERESRRGIGKVEDKNVTDKVEDKSVTEIIKDDNATKGNKSIENIENANVTNKIEDANATEEIKSKNAMENIEGVNATEEIKSKNAMENIEGANASDKIQDVNSIEEIPIANNDPGLMVIDDLKQDDSTKKVQVDEEKVKNDLSNSKLDTLETDKNMNDNKKRKLTDNDFVYFRKECVNYDCDHKNNTYIRAPNFILNFYKTPRKTNKPQFVCDRCYDQAVDKYEELCGSLCNLQPILYQDIPIRQDFVEIFDSSDEDETQIKSPRKDVAEFDEETVDLLEKELDDTICKILKRVEIKNQISWTKTILKNKIKNIEEESSIISSDLNLLQKQADKMHTALYQCPKIKLKQLHPVDLNTGPTNYNDSSIDSIPSFGILDYPPIELNGVYYAVKNKAVGSWLPSRVIEFMDVVIGGHNAVKYYKIQFLGLKIPTMKCVPAKHMAYGRAPTIRLSIGTRVIALFDGTTLSLSKDKKNTSSLNAFYPGIIAEQIQAYSKYRYLIFFDDGYAQYVQHKNVRVVCEASEKVWEDVHPGSREFIHNYLSHYQKHRPMVQVRKGQNMLTESCGKWIYAKVVDIDASLVQMFFSTQNRSEWIYRGSTRLGPLFKEKQTIKKSLPPILPRRSEPYVRYIQDDEPVSMKSTTTTNTTTPTATTNINLEKRSNVAKKSTAKLDVPVQTPSVKHLNNSTIFLEDDNRPKGKVVYYTAKKNMPPKSFVPHDCSPRCLFPITHNLNSYSPLAKPLLSGWERQIFKSKLKKVVVYRGPCGRRLRNMEELHKYLRQTKNTLNVENFDFDCLIHCLAEYVIESSIVQKSDISDGLEHMIIPSINYYDNSMPPECIYSTKRIPTEGVHLNLDPEFLVGCDCVDDCSDKSKCSCWRLTLAGARFGNPNTPPENVGYSYKRLPEPVPTGIYECNSKCKCAKNCLNRVVQQPLQMKLQVFKTSNRGWGLRCLNDVPKGSFICIYAGHLLTEQNANEGGANSGDEYFAELDYIEVVERLKEGYESDVQENESEEEDVDDPVVENDSDEDFRTSASYSKDASINTRLRARASSKKSSEAEDDPEKRKTANVDDDEDEDASRYQERQVLNFEANTSLDNEETTNTKYRSIRRYFGKNEYCYVMDAKKTGNIGRYFNHSCSPNLFVQNVFVDTHDLRFPWVAFFALSHIRAGTELTWNYNYEVGIVPGKVLYCECGAPNCRGRLL